MDCPVCEERLREVEKAGVVIGLCPGCKGGWLDRDELAKLTQMASKDDATSQNRLDEDRGPVRGRRDRRDDEDGNRDGRYDENGGKRKRGGFFDNISDLFGG